MHVVDGWMENHRGVSRVLSGCLQLPLTHNSYYYNRPDTGSCSVLVVDQSNTRQTSQPCDGVAEEPPEEAADPKAAMVPMNV